MSETDGRRLVLETNRDISDRKRAEAELREAQAISRTSAGRRRWEN